MKMVGGYNGKPTEIRVSANDHGTAEVWIDLQGLPKYSQNAVGTVHELGLGVETLSYMTITEAIALRNELNEAIKGMAGL